MTLTSVILISSGPWSAIRPTPRLQLLVGCVGCRRTHRNGEKIDRFHRNNRTCLVSGLIERQPEIGVQMGPSDLITETKTPAELMAIPAIDSGMERLAQVFDLSTVAAI